MKKRNPYKILSVLLTIALVVLLGLMVKDKIQKKQAADVYEELRKETLAPTEPESIAESVPESENETEATEETEAEPEGDILADWGIEIPERNLNWEAILEQNDDIIAWIYIPGTKVDYPVLQHPSDDTYYLEHNMDGSKGYPGCIYSELVNSTEFTDRNTVLYGHNMRDGSMFKTLHNYEDSSFFEENRTCYVYKPNGEILVYDIFAAYISGSEHVLHTYDFSTDEALEEYINRVYRNREMTSHIRRDYKISGINHILTMSTCINDPARRYLVQAVLINDSALTYTQQCELRGTAGE